MARRSPARVCNCLERQGSGPPAAQQGRGGGQTAGATPQLQQVGRHWTQVARSCALTCNNPLCSELVCKVTWIFCRLIWALRLAGVSAEQCCKSVQHRSQCQQAPLSAHQSACSICHGGIIRPTAGSACWSACNKLRHSACNKLRHSQSQQAAHTTQHATNTNTAPHSCSRDRCMLCCRSSGQPCAAQGADTSSAQPSQSQSCLSPSNTAAVSASPHTVHTPTARQRTPAAAATREPAQQSRHRTTAVHTIHLTPTAQAFV